MNLFNRGKCVCKWYIMGLKVIIWLINVIFGFFKYYSLEEKYVGGVFY